jgi:DNA-binding MarR family transcriptional regulator
MTKKIEDEIQSTKFKSEYHKAILNILYTSHWIAGQQSGVFKKYNVSPQQYNVLRILRGRHPQPCTLLTIRERMIDKMSDVSRIVERLRLAGFIDRTSCQDDRRAVDVIITQKGLDLLASMQDEVDSMERFLHNISIEEAEQLNNLLDKLRD